MGIRHRSSLKDDFKDSGPTHLTRTTIDWSNPIHRRSVVACLVKSVYTLENDRREERQGENALAPPWYKTFQFSLHKKLIDHENSSIFGAIFKLKSPPPNSVGPRFVIAFRGTILSCRDMKLNMSIVKNLFHKKPCAKAAIEAVRRMVDAFGNSNIWIAGHSLGASVSMLAGKKMAENNIFLDAYLFNPPYISLPIEAIKYGKKVKDGIRIAKSFIKVWLENLKNKNGQSSSSGGGFDSWSAWQPWLFVDPRDPICDEYVGYFGHRKLMEGNGEGEIERKATKLSMLALLMDEPSELVLHLIPSANLTVNITPSRNFKEKLKFMDFHGLHQWWRKDLELESNEYKYT